MRRKEKRREAEGPFFRRTASWGQRYLRCATLSILQGEIRKAHPPLPLYMREVGTMWQIGVLTGKQCTFLVQNGSFSVFWHYKNKERLSRGLDVKWHIPSTCLDAPRKWFSTGIYSINRASEWLWLETPKNP